MLDGIVGYVTNVIQFWLEWVYSHHYFIWVILQVLSDAKFRTLPHCITMKVRKKLGRVNWLCIVPILITLLFDFINLFKSILIKKYGNYYENPKQKIKYNDIWNEYEESNDDDIFDDPYTGNGGGFKYNNMSFSNGYY